MQIVVHLNGVDEAKAKMGTFSESLMNFTEVLTKLGEKLKLFYSDNVFISSGTALGKRWTPLAASTVAYKSKHYEGTGILERTGVLKDSFYYDVTPNSLFVSNNAQTPNGKSLFAIHQLGTTTAGRAKNTTIPARPMVGMTPALETTIKENVEADLAAKLAKAGL